MKAAILAAGVCCVALSAGCRRREPPESARDRVRARFLQQQIESLETLVAKAEGGGLETQGQIAIGISEEVVKSLFDASLPREVVLAQRVRLRLDSAEAFFRGNHAALLLRARISTTLAPDTYAKVELAGALKEFTLTSGQLVARVAVAHLSVLESSIGDLAADVIENLVKGNIESINQAIPPLVVPVSLEESVKIGGLTDGVVVANSGILPLAIKVARVIPVNERLWVLLDAKAGPWQALPTADKP